MHFLRKTQIAHLKADEASVEVSNKYVDFANVLLPKLAVELYKHMAINDHEIELIYNWQSFYSAIYNLGPVELATLKTYIKINLASNFIRSSKSLARAPIFFYKTHGGNLSLCVNYWGLHNLSIKNWYSLSLVKKSLDWPDWAWQFTQLNLVNAYYWKRIQEGDE